jgi:hypothetical protein
MHPSIRVDLTVTPQHVNQATLAELTASIAVTNDEDRTINPQVRQSRLLVDGVPSQAWSLAVGNGAGTEREFELPPGERVVVHRPVDAGLFDGPGDRELVAEVGGIRSAPVRVTVDEG